MYLRRLEILLREGATKVSSGTLGEALGVTDAQVRKDLAYLGNLGHPGVGYSAAELIGVIRRALGVDREWLAALAGVGNLGRALLRYRGFADRGFRIVALFDADPAKIGHRVEGLEIHSPDEMADLLPALGVELGVLTTPAESAGVGRRDGGGRRSRLIDLRPWRFTEAGRCERGFGRFDRTVGAISLSGAARRRINQTNLRGEEIHQEGRAASNIAAASCRVVSPRKAPRIILANSSKRSSSLSV